MNVIVITCDQLRFDALSINGNTHVSTPNLDRLAKLSTVFTRAYCQSPLCAPARHSILTGKYPHHNGVMDNSDYPFEGMYTIGHALKPLGVRRLQAGNMHWRGFVDHGFEPLICSRLNKNELSPGAYKRISWEENEVTRRTTAGASTKKASDYWGYQVGMAYPMQVGEVVERGESFLSFACILEPHPPFFPPEEIYRSIDQAKIPIPVQVPDGNPAPHKSITNRQKEWAHLTDVEIRQMIAGYHGMVVLSDNHVGMILDTLDRFDLWKDTMIILTADHGEMLGEHNIFLKQVLRENAVHVPFMVYHPDIAPGSCDAFVEHIDIFPTICDYFNADKPAGLDGRSLLPLLKEKREPDGWRTDIFSEIAGDRMLRTNEWKLYIYKDGGRELFDMVNDKNELFNLAADPAYADVVDELTERMIKK